MKHRQDSWYWSEARKRQEFREAMACCALLVLIMAVLVVWTIRHNPRDQINPNYVPQCQTINNATQGFCP